MIDTKKFLKIFIEKDIKFFCGVPDSCVNKFCDELNESNMVRNTVTANEGAAVSLGVGHYLSKKKLSCIYLQNSGLGNATDPLTNLSNKEVYGIPIILLIGWRGAPSLKDEAQHKIQGRILKTTLNSYQIKHLEINNDRDFSKIKKLIDYSKRKSRIVAFLVKPKVFYRNEKISKRKESKNMIRRQDLIISLLRRIPKKTKIISSVGFNSRELYQIRKKHNFKNGKDFLMVGAMGHTAMVAFGISQNTNDQIICLDGDGSFVMHLGALTLLSNNRRKNFKYILIDNGSHESIGQQPTKLKNINYKKISEGLGFKKFFFTDDIKKLDKNVKSFIKSIGPSFLHVKIKIGTLDKLARPKKFLEIKNNFMRN